MKRRTILGTSAAAITAGTAGCVSWPPWASPAGQEGSNENDNDEKDAESDSESEQEETPDGTDENKNDQQGNEQGQEDDEDTDGQEESDEQDSGPSEEDTEIDRDQYEDQEVSETEARSVDDIEVEADPEQHDDGSVTVTGTVTNVSDSSIDVVDLEIVFYGADDQYLGSDLATIRELDSGASMDFEGGAKAYDLQGDVERVQINPDVYDTK